MQHILTARGIDTHAIHPVEDAGPELARSLMNIHGSAYSGRFGPDAIQACELDPGRDAWLNDTISALRTTVDTDKHTRQERTWHWTLATIGIGQRAVGFCLYWGYPDRLHLAELQVRVDSQQRGVGSVVAYAGLQHALQARTIAEQPVYGLNTPMSLVVARETESPDEHPFKFYGDLTFEEKPSVKVEPLRVGPDKMVPRTYMQTTIAAYHAALTRRVSTAKYTT